MTERKALPRPPQVTMAGWMTIVGSVFVVLTMYDAVANLRSLENQERVERMLNDPPWDGTGLDVEQWLSLMQTLSMVAAACAAAAAILGWHVLQRNHAARIALSVVAVPLFLAGLVSGGFLTTLVAVAVVMLWTRPARDWFNGIPYTPPTPRQKVGADASSAPPAYPPAQPPAQPPSGPTPAPTLPEAAAPSQGQPHVGFGVPQVRPAFSNARPPALLRACLITWVCSSLTLAATIALFVALVLDPGLMDAWVSENRATQESMGLQTTEAEVRFATLLMITLVGGWALGAIVLAVLVWHRHDWARILLIMSAVPAAVLAALMFTFIVPIAIAVGCGITVRLLLVRDVRDWVQHRV